ncbi:hypothetical protein [Lactiplantibacillus plantarum]|uniref:hypothetical protein n=1 Tax=Lactiplantibacillus plantarum TaxID=1590 RepID=UPI001BA49C2F|nr:hypothetical protein [Lactiplantibacillus plantarum]MBS0954975.1 hypothetical protein [Lactiplantibacillus plantarum]
MDVYFYWHGKPHTGQLMFSNNHFMLIATKLNEVVMVLPQNVVQTDDLVTAIVLLKKQRIWSWLRLIAFIFSLFAGFTLILTSLFWHYLAASGKGLWLTSLLLLLLCLVIITISYMTCKPHRQLVFDNLTQQNFIYISFSKLVYNVTDIEVRRNKLWIKLVNEVSFQKTNFWQLSLNSEYKGISITDAQNLIKITNPKFKAFNYASKYWDSTAPLLITLLIVAIAFFIFGYSYLLKWFYIPLVLLISRLFFIAKKVNFFRI